MARETSRARRGFGRIERRESGRYRAAYTGPDGRLYRAPTTFDAKEDAVAWLLFTARTCAAPVSSSRKRIEGYGTRCKVNAPRSLMPNGQPGL